LLQAELDRLPAGVPNYLSAAAGSSKSTAVRKFCSVCGNMSMYVTNYSAVELLKDVPYFYHPTVPWPGLGLSLLASVLSSRYTCVRCGSKYCCRKCYAVHTETRCLKFMG
jgi:zinc finger HIT domain-containing protein 1